MQFSLGFFFFVDAAAFSKSAKNGSDVHITFVDWIPSIFSALGMLVINSIDKSRLSADSFSYSGNGVAWKARLVLFLGFALMAGGLAGSVVSSNIQKMPLGMLIEVSSDRHGAQICRPRIPVPYALVRRVQRRCECACDAQVSVPFPSLCKLS